MADAELTLNVPALASALSEWFPSISYPQELRLPILLS